MSAVLDQQYTTQNDSWGLLDSASHTKLAQAFTPSVYAKVNQAILLLQRVGSGVNTLTVDVYTNSGGFPGSIIASSSNSIDGTTITNSAGGQQVTFTVNEALLQAKTQYWIVLSGTQAPNGTNFHEWLEDDTGGNTGHPAANQDGSAIWHTLASTSFWFKEYYDSATLIGGLSAIL